MEGFIYSTINIIRQVKWNPPGVTGQRIPPRRSIPGVCFGTQNCSQSIPQYSLAMIFVCKNIPPVYLGYDFRAPNHTEVESFSCTFWLLHRSFQNCNFKIKFNQISNYIGWIVCCMFCIHTLCIHSPSA